MRYRLRTLLIVLALGPMVLAGAWFIGQSAIAKWRLTMPDTWEDVGGPGAIDVFNITCSFPAGDAEHAEESTALDSVD